MQSCEIGKRHKFKIFLKKSGSRVSLTLILRFNFPGKLKKQIRKTVNFPIHTK